MNQKTKSISESSVKRLPGYWRYLNNLKRAGRIAVSCTRIAQSLNLTAIQVRKDLAATGIIGRPKTGYSVNDLVEHIEKFLGWHNTREAILVGAGHLGRALLGYKGFEDYGLNIVCAFDQDSKLFGTNYQGKEILPVEKLPDLVKRMQIQIGIITTPAQVAQNIADQMIAGGIIAIWNFAPVKIDAPSEIIIENMELSASLAVLSHRLETSQTDSL